jgi:hypothetical protein
MKGITSKMHFEEISEPVRGRGRRKENTNTTSSRNSCLSLLRIKVIWGLFGFR